MVVWTQVRSSKLYFISIFGSVIFYSTVLFALKMRPSRPIYLKNWLQYESY